MTLLSAWLMACHEEPAQGPGPEPALEEGPPLLEDKEGEPGCETRRRVSGLALEASVNGRVEQGEIVLSWVETVGYLEYAPYRGKLEPDGTVTDRELLLDGPFDTTHLADLGGGVVAELQEGGTIEPGVWSSILTVLGLPERDEPLVLEGLYGLGPSLHPSASRWLIGGGGLLALDGGGNVLANEVFEGIVYSSRLVWAGESGAMAWSAFGDGGSFCQFAPVSLDGVLGASVMLVESACKDIDLLPTPSGWLAAWQRASTQGDQIWLRPLDPSGAPMGPARPLFPEDAIDHVTPKLAQLPGGQILLTWAEQPHPDPGYICAGCLPVSEVWAVPFEADLVPSGAPMQVEREDQASSGMLADALGMPLPLPRADGTVALLAQFLFHGGGIPAAGELACAL